MLTFNQTEDEIDTQLAEEIFQEIDKDGSGRVSIEEFVESYFE